MPTSSKLTGLVPVGDLAAYSIASTAIPADIADSSGSITTFSTVQAVNHDNHEYATGETLTLAADGAGTFAGRVVQSSKVKNSNVMNLSAETFMARLATEQRCFPIFNGTGLANWEVAAAVDHWSQQAGLFYDDLPGDVFAYSSMFGHDHMYTKDLTLPPHETLVQNGTRIVDTYAVSGSRVYRTLLPGTVSTLPINRIAGRTDTIPTRVPMSTSNDTLLFTTGISPASDRSVDLRWNFNKGAATVNTGSLKLIVNPATGFTLSKAEGSGSFTSVIAATGAFTGGQSFRVYLGLKEATTTTTTFILKVWNITTGAFLVDTTATATTALRGLLSWTSASFTTPNTGTGALLLWGFGGTIITGTLPTSTLVSLKALAATPVSNALIPGFSGDVWTHLKELLSVHRLDCWYENNKLCIGARDTTLRAPKSLASGTVNVQQREQARRIEVTCQNSVASAQTLGLVFFKADSVYQVATGEIQEVMLQTGHSIDGLNNPVAVTGITPYPYTAGTGQYVVTGSDGYIVSPTWWAANGGKITAEPTATEGEIKLVIKGPDYDSVRAPYRISEGDAGRPALYITGQGIINNPKVMQIATGNSKAAQDIGTQVDSPFITNRLLAYNAAAMVSLRYASPELRLSVTEAKDGISVPVFANKSCGAIFKLGGNVFRTVSGTQTAGSIQLESVQFNTIKAVNDYYANAIIGTTNTFKGSKTIKDATLKRIGTF